MIQEEVDRRARLQALRDQGINPYPLSGFRTYPGSVFVEKFSELLTSQEKLSLVGRIRAIRKHGGVTFIVLEDELASVQVAVKKDLIGEELYKKLQETFDVGDFLEVEGAAYQTKTEEPTILCEKYKILSKSLLPLPEKWHGLSDTEIRYRKRYLDLIVDSFARDLFRTRALIIQTIRESLCAQNFLEVETPILQPLAGGAEARPFVTHHNSLDADFFLRIAPELYLKRCLVGGFERVFEVARCFRNEGISFQHNPEFTQIEAYAAYVNFDELLQHLENLIVSCVQAIPEGNTEITNEEVLLSFKKPFPRKEFYDLVKEGTGIDLMIVNTEDLLRACMIEKGMAVEKIIGFGSLADELWKKSVRPHIIQPTFVIGYPSAMKPLAKKREQEPEKSVNVQLVVKGQEVINAFSELNDPLEQFSRFEEQQQLHDQGAEGAHVIDQDYIEALKVGMPPAFGYGIGIDRLCALLTGKHNIKEVILFPTLKPDSTEL